MTSIDPTYYLKNQSTVKEHGSSLGKDEFLKILMTQLQNQDPSNPMDDKEFISQMATFSSLEQMMQMNTAITNLVNNQMVSPVIQYSHLIGQQVTYYKIDEETGQVTEPKVEEISNVVAISQKEGYAVLELENGTKIYTDEIIKIEQNGNTPETEQPATEEPAEETGDSDEAVNDPEIDGTGPETPSV
ncbi:flagellar basal-body rod modification protein FlgD [Gracilibacillus ureilyticus]|uniref:Flagellar basal-body rod modification protein FlgD n=1 Tax=Gracilibacillus ureilyticus TaxID=531814 RepID=A0A1H9L611_9BACI|nr:flagellar hook assembly protein FlgD [Gracilibacillus ureilyticus]SER06453.1 flagellar basal-body rod modification protein FlgD [Gracilibacillus ureilyticus]